MKSACYRHIRSSHPRTVRPQPGHGQARADIDQKLPDISGAAPFGDEILVVHDLKDGQHAPRLGLMEAETGALRPLQTEWNGRIGRDIEALAKIRGTENDYLAVEASSWQDRKARLHELKVENSGAEAVRSHVLPDFGQEIEGLAEKPLPGGRRLIILGGRGTEDGVPSRLFWGSLDAEGQLDFPAAGLHGLEVRAPDLPGDKQRDISDLYLSPDGTLWATACTDNGDDGPFDSAVYSLGKVEDRPVRPQSQSAHIVVGTKLEAVTSTDEAGLYLGSDNENFGGQWGYLAFDCQAT